MIDESGRVAQTQPPGTDGAPTTGTAAGPNAGGGGGSLVDGVTIDPFGAFADILTGILQVIINTAQSLIDVFNRSLLTIPACGVIDNPVTWMVGGSSDPYCVAMSGVYLSSLAFILPFFWLKGWFRIGIPGRKRRSQRALEFGAYLVLFMVLFGLINGWNHLWNGASLIFAPSGEEFLSTPGNTAKFGAGLAAVVGLLMAGKGIVIIIGLVIHAVFVVLAYALLALSPVSVMLHYSEVPVASKIGTGAIVATLVLGPLQWTKSAILRVLFSLPIQPENPETLFSFFIIFIGVGIAIVLVPYEGLKRMVPRTIVGVGMGGLKTASSSAESKIRERAPSKSQVQATLSREDSNNARSKGRLSSRGGNSGSAETVSSRRVKRRRQGLGRRSVSAASSKGRMKSSAYSKSPRKSTRGSSRRSTRTSSRFDR